LVQISVTTENKKAEVTLNGSIDEQGAEQLKETFASLPVGSLTEVRVDFSGVDFIGSSGIGKLLLFYKNLAVQGGRLEAVGLSRQVYELFRELKLDTIFTVRAA